MDFSFTPEQEALRKDFNDFFAAEAKHLPSTWVGTIEDVYSSDEGWAYHKYMAQTLAKKGWLVRGWPKQYGGSEAPIVEQLIFNEVSSYYMAAGMDIFGIGMCGPTLMAAGTEEQKQEHVLPIARGEKMWCQLWSEPDAGSDLAALRATAVRQGDYYIINGQKIWTSGAHRADWGFGIFRTDPNLRRSKGLSFILVDMNTPGITIRPLYSMGHAHLFNEVFFDNVKVPVKNRVGEENQGWNVTRATMNFERSNVGVMSWSKSLLGKLIQFCKENKRDGKYLIDDPFVRQMLAQVEIEIEIGIAMSYRIAWIQEQGRIMEFASLASSSKVYGTEMIQRFANTALQILGMYGPIRAESKWAPLKGVWEAIYQLCPGMNILAGTSEIQRNTIAWIAMGMPRSWDEVFKPKA